MDEQKPWFKLPGMRKPPSFVPKDLHELKAPFRETLLISERLYNTQTSLTQVSTPKAGLKQARYLDSIIEMADQEQ